MNITIDADYIRQTLLNLVQINSVNPSLVPGAPGEGEIARYVTSALEALGLDVAVLESVEGRPSVVGRRRGKRKGRSLMLNAHYDTVGVDGMDDPFSGNIVDGRLFGRGAYDMKGSLAACLASAKALVDAHVDLAGDVVIAAVADEEYASLGTAEVIDRYSIDGAVVTEPTELDICVAHKGFVWLEIETLGRAAHGSRPDLGIDANMMMGRVLTELEELEIDLQMREQHRLVGRPSLHAAVIHGGRGPSLYSASCKLTVERRTVPGEFTSDVIREIEDILTQQKERDPTFNGRLRTILVRDPFEVSMESSIVKHVENAVQKVTGKEPVHSGQSPWMDSALLVAAGVETVVIGPAGEGAHAAQEWVDLRSVETLAGILAETAVGYCG